MPLPRHRKPPDSQGQRKDLLFRSRRSRGEQKALVVRLIRERGLSPQDAVRLAAEGVDGCAPFAMPKDSARLYASQAAKREERRRRADLATRDPRACVLAQARELTASVERDLGTLVALAPASSTAEAVASLELADRHSRMLSRLERLTRVSPQGQQPSSGAADGGDLAALLSD